MAKLARSPLAPADTPVLLPLAGCRLASRATGLKYRGRDDLCLIELAPGTAMAGVLTRSKTASAPVLWCRRALEGGRGRAILVNAGNANAFTGRAGLAAVETLNRALAGRLGCAVEEVYPASTGVIGEPLDAAAIEAHLDALVAGLEADRWREAAAAIMTTDTFPKAATRGAEIEGRRVTINGIVKGSGMIAPDLATMLAFVVTDAALPAATLQALLAKGCDKSFNATTVDGDTSTSDTVLLAATGAAATAEIADAGDPRLAGFKVALDELLLDLALQVVRDGEGASKFVAIRVSGAADARAARRIGLSIANSPLVKTAIAGEDANWGRIVMAVGKAGEAADRDRLEISIGGIAVARNGERVEGYDEAPVARHMKGQEIEIAVDVGIGAGTATVYTCDLTHGYIEINADYRS